MIRMPILKKNAMKMRQQYFTTDLRKIYDKKLIHEAWRYVSTMR